MREGEGRKMSPSTRNASSGGNDSAALCLLISSITRRSRRVNKNLPQTVLPPACLPQPLCPLLQHHYNSSISLTSSLILLSLLVACSFLPSLVVAFCQLIWFGCVYIDIWACCPAQSPLLSFYCFYSALRVFLLHTFRRVRV